MVTKKTQRWILVAFLVKLNGHLHNVVIKNASDHNNPEIQKPVSNQQKEIHELLTKAAWSNIEPWSYK